MSEMVVEGRVEALGPNKAGYWNVKIGDEWYSLSKTKPKFDKGDTVRFTYAKNGQWNNGDAKTVEVVEVSQAAPAAKAASSGGENWDARAKYWADKDKRDVVNQREHRLRFCMATAKDLVLAAVDGGQLDLGAAKKKGAQFESILVYVQETANDLYSEIETFMAENALEDDAKFALPKDEDSIE